MKNILFFSSIFSFAIQANAQCTPELTAQLPVSCPQYTNMKKYKGTGVENKTMHGVIFDPTYINKNVSETSVQFITLE